MWRYVVGVAVYMIWVGLFFIAAFGLAIAMIPTAVLIFVAGFLSNARPWVEMKYWNVWKWIRQDYFAFEAINEEKNVSSDTVIYAVFPHGHYSLSHLFYFALNPAYIHVRPAIHSFIFWIPFFATFAKWINAIDVSEKSLLKSLKQGESVIMCPAGIRDMLHTGTYISDSHKGFLRIAQEARVKVIPVWCPEERSYYTHYLPLGDRLTKWLHLPLPFPIIIWGRWWCPLLPKVPEKSRIVFGKPMDPSDADQFFSELRKLALLKEN